MSTFFTIASNWETIADDADRNPLRKLITDLVNYPCKLACLPNNGSVDIYVFSEIKKKITDWIEIQPDGALGVMFDMYTTDEPAALSDRCVDYNCSINAAFYSESESESSQSDMEESPEQQES